MTWVSCPDCPWTGARAELVRTPEGVATCPSCGTEVERYA